jgi:enoyl-CoA hydratase/carnithine racemase
MVDGRVNADIAEVSLNRPEAFNALNLELVTDLAGSDDGIGRRQQAAGGVVNRQGHG